jgi:hypothetical protein
MSNLNEKYHLIPAPVLDLVERYKKTANLNERLSIE